MVKNLPTVRETWVWCLGQEDPLEKGMATHCSIPAWRIPWTRELGRLQSKGSQRVGMTERLTQHTDILISTCHNKIISDIYILFSFHTAFKI